MTGEQGKAGEWVAEVMAQAQVFASGWALVGGRFDDGSMVDSATEEKAALRSMLTQREAAFAAVVEAAKRLTACYRVSHSPAVRESCWAQMSAALALARAGEGKV